MERDEVDCRPSRGPAHPDVPDDVLESWQHILNAVTARLNVPVGVIMRVAGPEIEVLTVTHGGPMAPSLGTRQPLADSSLYCEWVLRKGEPLAVADAAGDPYWSCDPSLRRQGLRSYLGYPVRWPDGSLFGTICVMDTRARSYTTDDCGVIALLRDLIETNLRGFCEG